MGGGRECDYEGGTGEDLVLDGDGAHRDLHSIRKRRSSDLGDGTRGFTSNLKTNAPAVPRRPAVRRFTFLFAFKGITVLTAVFLGSPGLDGSLTLFAWQKAILLAATAIRFFGFMFFIGRVPGVPVVLTTE